MKTQMIFRNYIQISQRKGKKKSLLGMWVFFAQIYYIENFSNFKNNVFHNNGSILEITSRNNYYGTRGNVSFTELSETKNALTNQDFARLDKSNKLENLFCKQGISRKF